MCSKSISKSSYHFHRSRQSLRLPQVSAHPWTQTNIVPVFSLAARFRLFFNFILIRLYVPSSFFTSIWRFWNWLILLYACNMQHAVYSSLLPNSVPSCERTTSSSIFLWIEYSGIRFWAIMDKDAKNAVVPWLGACKSPRRVGHSRLPGHVCAFRQLRSLVGISCRQPRFSHCDECAVVCCRGWVAFPL